MKVIEVTQVPTIVTNEEHKIFAKIQEQGVLKSDLSEREQVIANRLVEKSLIKRRRRHGKPYYVC